MKNPIRWLIPVLFILSCSHESYQVTEESYEDGTQKLVRYYEDETKAVLEKETQYYEDGSKYIEGSYKNGERHGTWNAWYRDGKLWSTGEYKDGMEHGIKTVYHENGQKYYEGELTEDKRTGIWTFWNKEGKELKKVDYNTK